MPVFQHRFVKTITNFKRNGEVHLWGAQPLAQNKLAKVYKHLRIKASGSGMIIYGTFFEKGCCYTF